MALDLRDCAFLGPALPEPFVKFQLEAELHRRKLLPRAIGDEGRALQDRWEVYRRKLRELGEQGGNRRVASHVLDPLAERLGYERFEPQAEVITREGPEDGGWLFTAADGQKLRAWSVGLGVDLDAPSRRGRAYRFSPSRVAQRVLLASGERVGLLTDGEELRLLLCDPARPDSHIAIRLDRSGGWRAARGVPDSYRLLLALASPAGVAVVPDLAEAARLAQSTVTKKLRLQARTAIEGLLQEVLDHPDNAAVRAEWPDAAVLAKALWREGLILVYRLLFVFKLESSADPARAFSFAATSLWRNTYSPNTALAGLVRRVLDQGADSGGFLEAGLRVLWRMFAEGMSSSELEIKPLGGMLFGGGATPLLDRLSWGERGVARLLDALMWTPGDGNTERERVHYGALDVEDLGRVYEALLELEPGISTVPMCRLRRAKLEVVVPLAQGAPYRTGVASDDLDADDDSDANDDEGGNDDENGGDDEAPKRRRKSTTGSKTKVQFIEEIPTQRFFLRVGLGRKASGSYYTPHPFVRFLVQETLGPQLDERSPNEDPQPGRILELKVLDPAMGSGHFLVEACRYLGEALYEACRLCDGLAVQAEEQAEKAAGAEREVLLAHAAVLRKRVEDLPDPDGEMVAYLPSRVAEGEESGLSQRKAEAMCRRLVAVHCLYGVDKNLLAVELAKLSLWLESYAEGLPLTFMDHRLIQGDSLTGPFFEHLLTYPKSGEKLDDLFAQGLTERLEATLAAALVHVRDLEASVGKDVADLEHKRAAKEKLDAALVPLKTLAAAWSGGVMLGDDCDDAGYQALAEAVGSGVANRAVLVLAERAELRAMVETGRQAVAFELAFPEVFRRLGRQSAGFDGVVGNPPWDKPHAELQLLLGCFDLSALDLRNSVEMRARAASVFEAQPEAQRAWDQIEAEAERLRRVVISLVREAETRTGEGIGASHVDVYMAFAISGLKMVRPNGAIGMVLSGGFAKNPAATPVRALWIREAQPLQMLQFDNRHHLFADLPTIIEFCVAASAQRPCMDEFSVGVALVRFEDLAEAERRPNTPVASVRSSKLLTFADLASNAVVDEGRATLWEQLTEMTSHLLQEVYPSRSPIELLSAVAPSCDDPRRPPHLERLLSAGMLPVLEGRSIGQFEGLRENDHPRWNPVPTQVLVCSGSEDALERVRYFRLAVRRKVGSPKSNLRSLVGAVLPPGLTCSDSLMVEASPARRSNAGALVAAALANAFPSDGMVRPHVQVMVTQKLLDALRGPRPFCSTANRLLAHSSMRLHAESAAYAPLWTEQLGDSWREPTPKHTWPVLDGDDARWAVRAAIDAVVADAYGLHREQYGHVLSTFTHRSYPRAPDLCLAAFDELKTLGLEAFTRKHDPYWDIPLNESLPKPVIDLPMPGVGPTDEAQGPLIERSGQVRLFADNGPLFVTPAVPSRPPAGDTAYDTLVRLLDASGLITSGDAQQATGLDAAAVRSHLKRLVDEGRAVTVGERRGMKYRRVDG